jgi:tetratricopeptide (TPR) repeat protein
MSRYHEDLDYLIQDVDITEAELEEIIREADSILSGQNPDTGQKAGALLKKAQALQKLNKYDESREYAEQALALKPEMPEALVRLGNVYNEKKEYDRALECITKSIGLDNKYVYAYCMRGLVYGKMGDYGKALADYTRAIELKPDFATAYNNRGVAYKNMEEYGKALADYTRAIELKPDDAMAYSNRGIAYGKMGEHGKALADYTRTIELNPDFATAYNNRGNAYVYMGDYGKALADYTRAIELKPDFATAYNNRGVAYKNMEEYGKALADFTRTIELNPDLAEAYYNRGIVYGEMGDYGKALADHTRTIELNPDLAEAYYNRGVVYGEMGDYGKAVADYNRAIELNPDDAAAYYNRGNAYYGKGEHGKALANYARAIELNPDLAEAYHNRSVVYGKMGDYGKALADYTRAIELNPDLAEAYYNRGVVYGKMGDYGKALADYTRAIELKPDLADAYHNRSIVYSGMGKYDEAFRDELKCLEYMKNSQDRDSIAKIQWGIDAIIKNSGSLDFIWKHTEEALERVPHFFSRIIASFIKEGFTAEKYKDLVNAVFELWKGCYGVAHDEDGKAVILYQYTTMPVLRVMFDSQSLRLSPASYLNDPNEGKTVFAYLREGAKKDALKKYLEKIQKNEQENADIIFIRSFTDNEDRLVMWDSSYADNGRGVSVGIPAALVDKGSGTPKPADLTINADAASPGAGEEEGLPVPLKLLGLFKIKYGRDCVAEIAKCLEAFGKKDFSNDKLTKLMARLFLSVAALIKSEDYRHESEYRLVYIASREDTVIKKYIKQAQEGGVYIETEKVLFEKSNYTEVYMGPRVDKITRLKWQDSFRYKYPEVKVTQSKIEWQ